MINSLSFIRFPASYNCPDTQAFVTQVIEEDDPYQNYFFPDYDLHSCAHGRDYPVSDTMTVLYIA